MDFDEKNIRFRIRNHSFRRTEHSGECKVGNELKPREEELLVSYDTYIIVNNLKQY